MRVINPPAETQDTERYADLSTRVTSEERSSLFTVSPRLTETRNGTSLWVALWRDAEIIWTRRDTLISLALWTPITTSTVRLRMSFVTARTAMAAVTEPTIRADAQAVTFALDFFARIAAVSAVAATLSPAAEAAF